MSVGDALPHTGPYSVDVKTMLAPRVLVEHPGTRLRLGPEVVGGAPKMHRRKAGGGGS